jgi:hypothetical protein
MEYPVQAPKPRYDLGKWFEQAWNVFKAHIWELVLLQVLVIVPAALIGGGYGLYVGRQHGAGGPHTWQSMFPLLPSLHQAAVVSVFMIGFAAVLVPFAIGISAVALNLVRTNVFDLGRIWTGFRKWPDSFIIGLVFGLISSAPSLFPLLEILLPVWLAVHLWSVFAMYALTEPGADHRSAIRRALRLVAGNFWWAVLFFLTAWLLALSGVVLCCVGLLFTSAFYQALTAVAYNDLSSSVAAPHP